MVKVVVEQHWQYVVEGCTGLSGMQQKLASFAAQGWEFVDVLKTGNAGLQLVLKRPVSTEENSVERPGPVTG